LSLSGRCATVSRTRDSGFSPGRAVNRTTGRRSGETRLSTTVGLLSTPTLTAEYDARSLGLGGPAASLTYRYARRSTMSESVNSRVLMTALSTWLGPFGLSWLS
jgi:hypothetical protein